MNTATQIPNLTQPNDIVVLKFGSSVIPCGEALADVVQECYRHVREGRRVIAVLSAIGDTTSRLLADAHHVASAPDPAALAGYLETGEATTMALCSLYLARAGLPHRCLGAESLCIRTQGPRLNATPYDVDQRVLWDAFAEASIVVVPGFIGRCDAGLPSLLGRGGSDLTALFLAKALDADCILYKDVDGIYEADPATAKESPRRFEDLTWECAIKVGGPVVQEKAVRFAQSHDLSFSVTCIGACHQTLVGSVDSRFAASLPASPLRVTLLGLGTVGLGVYQRLCAHPTLFSIVGIGVRDTEKYAHLAPASLLTNDVDALLERPSDLVIALTGGTTHASEWIAKAITSGRDVITANKDVIATQGEWLRRLALLHGVSLRYAASVGGVLPAIEALDRLSVTQEIRGFQVSSMARQITSWHDWLSVSLSMKRSPKPKRKDLLRPILPMISMGLMWHTS